MWTRIKTAIILLIIVGVALFVGDTPYLFIALLAVGVTIAAYEFTKLVPTGLNPILFIAAVLILTMLTIVFSPVWPIWWIGSIAIWLMALSWVTKFPIVTGWYGRRLAAIGGIILIAAISAMYYLWQYSPWWLMYVFLLVWCADSGAYFVGRKFGRRKMAPNVSPNKTLEGLGGGLATGLIVVIAISLFKLKLSGYTLVLFVILSGITIAASVLGDLFESMLKRQANIKDSGSILPGHGGVLDRIDSLLSATPIFALGFWLLHKMDLLVL